MSLTAVPLVALLFLAALWKISQLLGTFGRDDDEKDS